MDEQVTAIPVERIGKAPLARIGLVGAAAAALVAVGILAAGAGAAPAGTLAAADGAASGLVNAVQAGAGLPDSPGGPGNGQMDAMGRMGGRRGGMGGPGGMGGITITAISGSNVSLATVDGWTRTITVDSGTTFEENGTAVGLTDLKVGDEVRFRENRETTGKFTIDAIAVIPPHVGGTVSALSDTSITITARDGSSITITINAATTYDVNGATGTLAGLKTGMVLMASGTKDADGILTATEVRAIDPGQFGPGHFGPGHDGFHGGDVDPNGGSMPGDPSTPATPSAGTSNG